MPRTGSFGGSNREMHQSERSGRPPALTFKALPTINVQFGDNDSDSDGENQPLVSPHRRSRDADFSDSEAVFEPHPHLHDRHLHPSLRQHGGPFSPLPTPITNPSFSHSQHRRRPSRSLRRLTFTLSLSHVSGFWRCVIITLSLLFFLVILGFLLGLTTSRENGGVGWMRGPHGFPGWGHRPPPPNCSRLGDEHDTGSLVQTHDGGRYHVPIVSPALSSGYDTSKNITGRFRGMSHLTS
jgi:hypothetical protein